MVDVFDPDLDVLLSEPVENNSVDFKSWRIIRNPRQDQEPNRRKIAEALVAFTNRDGGKVVIGVDDDKREPEGEDLDEERINRIISEVAKDWCEPNIQWDNKFYSAENDDLSQGDIYVLQVDKRRGPPHAIDHGEGKREYLIRAGEESRRVQTDELTWLFQNKNFPDYSESLEAVLLYHKDLEPIRLDVPTNHNLLQQIFFDLSDDDIEYLTDDFHRMMEFTASVSPFAFLNSLNIYHLNSWDVEFQKTKRERGSFSSNLFSPSTDSVKPNLDIPTNEVDQVKIEGIDTTILENLTINEEDLSGRYDFKTPPDVDVEVILGDATEQSWLENKSVYGESALVFSKSDKFEFIIEFGKGMEGGVIEGSIPIWPSISVLVELGDYGEPLYEDLGEIGMGIRFLPHFKFPDLVDNQYDLHTQYASNLRNVLSRDWDANRYVEEMPDPIFYSMDYKLDMLTSAFDLT